MPALSIPVVARKKKEKEEEEEEEDRSVVVVDLGSMYSVVEVCLTRQIAPGPCDRSNVPRTMHMGENIKHEVVRSPNKVTGCNRNF